ncbi:MAG TPA: hypothetical protein VJZ27_04030, partial [Aggregatilineales bacterium]|nr:hypothetical protein [Aggregatilineales bacterium]
ELLRDPQRLFEANRLLREVSRDSEQNMPLQADDFTQSSFQAIFHLFKKACLQDNREPLDYLLEHADDILRKTIDDLLPLPLDIYARKAGRMIATELESIQRDQKRYPRIPTDEFPRRILALRRERIQREGKEIYFMLTEAQKSSDSDLVNTCTVRFSQLKRTLMILDAAIQ